MNFMDRSIHCAFFGNGDVPFDRFADAIQALREAMDQLGLDYSARGVGRKPAPFPALPGRYDKDERMLLLLMEYELGDNEWLALVVTRYLIALTRQMPGLVIKAHDDGRYFLVDDLVFRDGAATLDPERSGPKGGEASPGAGHAHVESWAALALSPRSDALFATIAAERYASEPAIKALGLTRKELARMTLEDVAARVVFPWERPSTDAT